jgi:hypothetical protein
VDYDEVELRIRKVLGVEETVGGETLAHRISGKDGDFRKGLMDKAADALVLLLQPEFFDNGQPNRDYTPKAGQYQALLFPFLKNAAANPIKNVLGGDDDWGRDRRAELVAIVEEGVAGGK